jgi:seryl-tRNA synthetase
MVTESIALRRPLAKAYAEEIEKRVFFASADIVGFRLVVQDDLISAVEVTTEPGVDMVKLADKINYLVSNDVASQKLLPPRIIWRSGGKPTYQPDIFERLVEQELAFEAGEGQVCVGEPVIRLMDRLDDQIKGIAASLLGAREYRYPTVIPVRVLQDCGYFDSFPHMLMFVTRLHNDVDTYRDFQTEFHATGQVESLILGHSADPKYCLPPTMCYHTYHQLRDRQFPEEHNQVITSRGKSFRYESKYHRSLERLWDFTIREIVFLGSRDYVLDCRQRFMDAAFALVEELGLAAHCEVASDPFFCSPDTAAKILNQKMLALKYELRMNVEQERTIAVASFNFHDQFFGERFKIARGEDWIRTGCVGFGLERLAYAFLCQHGLDEAAWPQPLK